MQKQMQRAALEKKDTFPLAVAASNGKNINLVNKQLSKKYKVEKQVYTWISPLALEHVVFEINKDLIKCMRMLRVNEEKIRYVQGYFKSFYNAVNLAQTRISQSMLEMLGINVETRGYFVKLVPNETVVHSNGSVLISEFDSKALAMLSSRAKTFSYYYLCNKDPKTPQELVHSFNLFVKNAIAYDGKWYEDRHNGAVSTDEIINQKAGVCKEKSALLYLLLRREGIDTSYCSLRPTQPNESGHVFVTAKISGIEYIADPTWGIFGKYEETYESIYVKKAKLVHSTVQVLRP